MTNRPIIVRIARITVHGPSAIGARRVADQMPGVLTRDLGPMILGATAAASRGEDPVAVPGDDPVRAAMTALATLVARRLAEADQWSLENRP